LFTGYSQRAFLPKPTHFLCFEPKKGASDERRLASLSASSHTVTQEKIVMVVLVHGFSRFAAFDF
jgi:hypothetical protein